jgi:hypothetical protein
MRAFPDVASVCSCQGDDYLLTLKNGARVRLSGRLWYAQADGTSLMMYVQREIQAAMHMGKDTKGRAGILVGLITDGEYGDAADLCKDLWVELEALSGRGK